MSKIGALIQHLGLDIENLFDGGVHELETVILPAAIDVTNAAKTIVDGDTSDIIGKLVGSAGAALEDKVRSFLDTEVPKLQLAQQFLAGGGDFGTILEKVISLVGVSPVETKTAFWIEFSGKLAQALMGGKLTIGQATALAQYFYENYPGSPTTAGASASTHA